MTGWLQALAHRCTQRRPVQEQRVVSAAMPMLWPSVGCGWIAFANVHGDSTRLDRRRNTVNLGARMRVDHATAEDLALAAGLGRTVKQKLGDALIAAMAA